MKALIKSYEQEIERIEKRGGVWMQGFNGWFHCYNSDVVKLKISILKEAIVEFEVKLNNLR